MRQKAKTLGQLTVTAGPTVAILEREAATTHALRVATAHDSSGKHVGAVIFCTSCGGFTSTIRNTRPRPHSLLEV